MNFPGFHDSLPTPMPQPTTPLRGSSSITWICTAIWILLASGFTFGAIILSLLGQLNRPGNAVLLALGVAGAIAGYYKLNGNSWSPKGVRWHRFRKPFPLIYLLCALAALIGGAIHAPTNHDGLSYRIPRLLHWMAEGRWHWIGGADPRMDFSGVGFEAMMLPSFAALHTLRFAFGVNAVSYLLLPGLVFSVFTALGIRKSIAATWMWILPCASCFVMEAGSIGNDFLACVYVLAALMFGLRAIQSGNRLDVILAVLAAALMTSVKASNLPLLLPITICMIAVFFKHPKRIITAALTCGFAAFVSFVPIAIANIRHTGDWTGMPESGLKLHNPLAGLAGNTLLIGSASLAPAVFPQAERVNSAFNSFIPKSSLSWIQEDFVSFRMTHPQLASEENSGLGLGVTAALFLGLAGAWRHFRPGTLLSLGGLISGGFWIALVFYMIKLGNCGAPRLVAPYYAGLIALPLLTIRSGGVFKRRWWRWTSLVLLLPILPALILNPARPLFPMKTLVSTLMEHGVESSTLSRMQIVYEVYANRADAFQSVRKLLPAGTRSIAFAGTSGDSEYSFWLPLGTRRVTDFTPTSDGRPPGAAGFDAIVASEWGTKDRFGMTPGQLAAHLDWKIIGTTEVRALAASEAVRWSVLVPKASGESNE